MLVEYIAQHINGILTTIVVLAVVITIGEVIIAFKK